MIMDVCIMNILSEMFFFSKMRFVDDRFSVKVDLPIPHRRARKKLKKFILEIISHFEEA